MRRNLRQILDEMRALGLQALYDVLVVHDLVAHVDRGTVFLQGALDDFDRADHAGAKTARLSEYHLHQRPPGGGPDCGVAPQSEPSVVFHVQYFGHNTMTTKLAMMPRQSTPIRTRLGSSIPSLTSPTMRRKRAICPV